MKFDEQFFIFMFLQLNLDVVVCEKFILYVVQTNNVLLFKVFVITALRIVEKYYLLSTK